MEPLITLIAVTFGLLLLGAAGVRPLRRIQTTLRGGLSAMFTLTGVPHFIGMREEMIAMVPDVVPSPEIAVALTGVAELAGAVGLLIPRFVLPAASGLALLLICVFPANVALALSNGPLPWYDQLLWRTLTQLVFLAATTTVIIDQYRAWRSSRRLPQAVSILTADDTKTGSVS